jgi:hypothetical protein
MKKTTLLLLILAVFIVGCAGEQAITTTENPFIGGTKALKLSFVANAPPDEIFDKSSTGELSPFDIVVNIENVGEANIAQEKLTLELSGIYAGDFVFSGKPAAKIPLKVSPVAIDTSISVLEGKNKGPNNEVIPGGLTQYAWEGLAYNKELTGTLPNIPIEARACYQYSTSGIGLYCLRKEPLSTKRGVCEIDDATTIYNSAAPVQITSFKESAAGRTAILFTFSVKKFGSGEVSKPTTKDTSTPVECSSTFTNKNKVYVKVDAGIADALSCSGLTNPTATTEPKTFADGYLTLDDATNDAIFSCRLSTADVTGDAVKALNIDLIYDYSEKISKKITIKHLLS